ncbi:MAG: RAD55 family ATPase [Methanobacteriota archaeon]
MGDRVATGIAGFDRLVAGGFPRGTVNLLAGPAGSGKSLFGLHFIHYGAARGGDTGMYVVLEENRAGIERALAAYGLESSELERSGRFLLVDLGAIRTSDSGRSVVGFEDLEDFLSAALATTRARRLVIDSLSAVGLFYATPEVLRERMFLFTRFLRSHELTSLLITDSVEGGGMTRFGVEQFVADSFVYLGLEEVHGDLRRTLTVRKMRFTRHDTSKHPVHITPAGMAVLDDEKVV